MTIWRIPERLETSGILSVFCVRGIVSFKRGMSAAERCVHQGGQRSFSPSVPISQLGTRPAECYQSLCLRWGRCWGLISSPSPGPTLVVLCQSKMRSLHTRRDEGCCCSGAGLETMIDNFSSVWPDWRITESYLHLVSGRPHTSPHTSNWPLGNFLWNCEQFGVGTF